ncbi:nucleotidyltransferase family protein [bacterium]|nr:nucleotidyltransferase family protein [bacterium]
MEQELKPQFERNEQVFDLVTSIFSEEPNLDFAIQKLNDFNEEKWQVFHWHGVIPLAYERIKSQKSLLRKEVFAKFQFAYLNQTARNLLMVKQLWEIEKEFGFCGINPILIKGSACLAEQEIFPNVKLRPMVDLDFWVKGKDFDKATDFFLKNNYKATEDFVEDGKLVKITLHKKGDLLTVELHRDFNKSFRNYFNSEDAFGSAVFVPNSSVFLRFSDEWHLIIRLIHDTLGNDYILNSRMIYLLEVYFLLRKMDNNYSKLNKIIGCERLKNLFGFYSALALRILGSKNSLPFEKTENEFLEQKKKWNECKQFAIGNFYHAESRYFRVVINRYLEDKVRDFVRIFWYENVVNFSVEFLIQEYKIKNRFLANKFILKGFHFFKLIFLFLVILRKDVNKW